MRHQLVNGAHDDRRQRHRASRVEIGGHRRPGPGQFFDPTVLSGCDHSMSVMTGEIFGPVVPFMAVSSDEETAAYVAELERRTDELDLEEHEDLPSGDSLAAELTRFLRERDAENGDDGPRER